MANKDIVNYYNWITSKNNQYNITAAVDPYSCYDIIQFKGKEDYCYIELKGRDVLIDEYDDCIVEEEKINKLNQLSQDTGKDVFLVALYYRSNKIAIWKVKDTSNYEVSNIKCKWHTATDSPKVIKSMVKFPLKDAKTYKFTYDTDIQ